MHRPGSPSGRDRRTSSDAILVATGWTPAIETDGECVTHARRRRNHRTGSTPPDGQTEPRPRPPRTTPPRRLNCRCSAPSTAGGSNSFATDTPPGQRQHPFLEARHRAHARVEERIAAARTPGSTVPVPRLYYQHRPGSSSHCRLDLPAWTARPAPRRPPREDRTEVLRYRLLHVAARLVRTRPTDAAPPSPRPGPGRTPSSPRSPASPHYPTPPPEPRSPNVPTNHHGRNPAHAPGRRHALTPIDQLIKINNPPCDLDQQLVKDRG